MDFIVLEKEFEQLKRAYKDRESDIEFHFKTLQEIEQIRLEPYLQPYERLNKIGDLVRSIIEPSEYY